jgi:ferredoxin like protein
MHDFNSNIDNQRFSYLHKIHGSTGNLVNSTCPHKCTTYVCPANCYTKDEEGKVHFQVEDCIECGTCMYACDQGAVSWEFPDPEIGRGVTWNFG